MVALKVLCHIYLPSEQVRSIAGHLKSHETSLSAWLNWSLLNAASGVRKEINVITVDDVAMNCSLRHISVIVKQYDSVAQMQRFQDIWDSYWHLKISPLISANSSRRVANSLTCRHWRWTKPHWKCCRSAVPRGCRVAKCSAFTERQGVGTGSLIQTYLTLSK